MIPKKIHYVWVGNQKKNYNIKKCMKTWRNHLSDYEIIEWNENNFDMHIHPFLEEAYKQKKWAYVSDYIRSYVIYNEGGIYLDTDVLVLDDLTEFLDNRAFVGFETPDYPFTAVFGAEKNHPLLQDMLNYYDTVSFSFDPKEQMKNVNTKIVSNILIDKYGCSPNNQKQRLREDILVYPDTYLCNPSEHSSTIHVFTGTWMEGAKPLKRKLATWLKLRINSKKKAEKYAEKFR